MNCCSKRRGCQSGGRTAEEASTAPKSFLAAAAELLLRLVRSDTMPKIEEQEEVPPIKKQKTEGDLTDAAVLGDVEEEQPLLRGAAARRIRKAEQEPAKKEYRRQKRKERRAAAQQKKAEARKEQLADMTEEQRVSWWAEREAQGRKRLEDQEKHLQQVYECGKPIVVVNCSFSDTMDAKELRSLAKQVQMSYVGLRDAKSQIQLRVTSLTSENPATPALERQGFRKWKLHTHEEPVWEVFDTSKLIFLTPDAEEDLQEVDEEKVYVIGGIVDRSVSKLQSKEQAEKVGGVSFRKLPIKSHGPSGAHPVLNIDTVVRILAERLKRDDWPGILVDCLPARHAGGPTPRMVRKQRRQARLEEEAKAAGRPTPSPGEDIESSSGSDADSSSCCSEADQDDGLTSPGVAAP